MPPAFVFLFGGWREVPAVSWVWLIALNGALGVTYATVYLRIGILGAILAHLGTDLVWHAATQLLSRCWRPTLAISVLSQCAACMPPGAPSAAAMSLPLATGSR